MSEEHPVILSLGAGVQSTAIALMSVDGHLPKIDRCIFSDTGWEPKAVYTHLKRLSDELAKHGIPVDLVSNGNIRDDALDSSHRFASMPLYMKGEAGGGMARRQCTNEYKLTPIKRRVRQILGAKTEGTLANGSPRVGRVGGRKGGKYVEMWVGISTDEIERQRPSDVQYIHRVDPLIDILSLDRTSCQEYLNDRWPWEVERSACIGCPFHDNREWRRMRDDSPVEFADAVDFDSKLREGDSIRGFTSEAYLHGDRVPLSEANFEKIGRKERQQDQGRLFPGCNPFDCERSHGQ